MFQMWVEKSDKRIESIKHFEILRSFDQSRSAKLARFSILFMYKEPTWDTQSEYNWTPRKNLYNAQIWSNMYITQDMWNRPPAKWCLTCLTCCTYVQMTSEWKTKATLKVFIFSRLVTESRPFSWLCFRAQKFQGGRTENQADGHCKTFWAVWDLKLIACCFICFLQSFSCRCFGIHWKCRKSANSLKSMLMSQGNVDAWFRCHELSGWDWDALGRLPAVASGWGGNDSCTRSCTRGATDSHRSRVAATQIKTFHWFFDIFCRLPKWSATQEMQGPRHFELGNFSSSFWTKLCTSSLRARKKRGKRCWQLKPGFAELNAKMNSLVLAFRGSFVDSIEVEAQGSSMCPRGAWEYKLMPKAAVHLIPFQTTHMLLWFGVFARKKIYKMLKNIYIYNCILIINIFVFFSNK